MGRQVESNWGLDYQVLKIIILNLEERLGEGNTALERAREATMLGLSLVMSFLCSLHGNEDFMLEAEGLEQMINFGKDEVDENLSHVVMPLLGRFKNEEGEK